MRYSESKYCLIDFKAIKIRSIYFIDFASNHNAIFSWNLIRLNNSSSWNQNKNLIHSNHESVIKIPQKEQTNYGGDGGGAGVSGCSNILAVYEQKGMTKIYQIQ